MPSGPVAAFLVFVLAVLVGGIYVFVELRQLPYAGRWQVRAFGSPAALTRLHAASAGLAVGTGPRPCGSPPLCCGC